MNNSYRVIGLMSGSSIDGLDIAYCSFEYGLKWTYKLGRCKTIPYPEKIERKLRKIHNLSSDDVENIDREFGIWMGVVVQEFINEYELEVDFISSHGHTVYHQPEKGITKQIGDGGWIFETTNIPVVFDFRSIDISLGGQGAPLVPIGDQVLFSEFEFCLNLGGISNISYQKRGNRYAYDICAVNQVLNYLSEKLGYNFDDEGSLAKKGKFKDKLYNQLNDLDYYKKSPPKSLGMEWVKKNLIPLINEHKPLDSLRTYTEHIAQAISSDIAVLKRKGKVLVTGGGAHNSYLMQLISNKLPEGTTIVKPQKQLIDYKEALVFALLGILRVRHETNVYSTVTGSKRDSCSGVLVGEILF